MGKLQDKIVSRKTGKREMAIALCIFTGGLIVYSIVAIDNLERFTEVRKLIETMFWPVISYTALAYGLQWSASQGSRLFGVEGESDLYDGYNEDRRNNNPAPYTPELPTGDTPQGPASG